MRVVLSLPAFAVCLGLTIRQYRRYHYRWAQFWALALGLAIARDGLWILADVTGGENAWIVPETITAFLYFTVLLMTDVFKRDRVSHWKMVPATSLTTAGVVVNLLNLTYALEDLRWILSGLFFGFGGIILLVECARILHESPPSLRRAAGMAVTGAALWACIMPLLVSLRVRVEVSGFGGYFAADAVFVAGFLLLTAAFLARPALAYVLAFKLLRLTVIETEAGIPLFTHTWPRGWKMADDDLFGGMVQGVSMIVRESVGRGHVREIQLDKAVLLLNRAPGRPVVVVLATTRTSKILRETLARFTTRFTARFSAALAHPAKVSQFASASELVHEHFPFVPSVPPVASVPGAGAGETRDMV